MNKLDEIAEDLSLTVIKNSGYTTYKNKNGSFHRNFGPAIIWNSGLKEWYKNGTCHRLDGAAIEWEDGGESFYINGTYYTEDAYWKHSSVVRYMYEKESNE